MRVVGWLAAVALLAHGWLPVLDQVWAGAGTVGGHHHAMSKEAPAPDAGHPDQDRTCPITHDVICLCAAFAKVLPAAGAPGTTVARAPGSRRGRFPAGRLPRPAPPLPFEPRAQPGSD